MKEISSKAIIYAFGRDGLIVHSQILDIHQYYDTEQVFDSWYSIKAAGILRLVGILFDSDGNITQEFEQTYDETTGEITGIRDYSYREHLKTDERHQKVLALFENRRKQREVKGIDSNDCQ
jgi:hypothetical protein